MHEDIIDRFMTSHVHTIAANRTLDEAHELMRSLKVRHLPVLRGGKVVGMVSQRDLSLIESLPGVDPQTVTVDDAMSEEVFSVAPGTLLAEVARKMAERKLGSVVVMEKATVVGIFTAVDALKTLDRLISNPAVRHALEKSRGAASKSARKY